MEPFGPATFGELNAYNYDDVQDPGTTDQAIEVISKFAAKGRTLELAIGTGRVALPLVQSGLDVSGIDGSVEMVEKLRAKPGGKDIPVVIGDMKDVDIDGSFCHIFLIYNTIFNLQSQQDQVTCFQNVANKLEAGGTFLVETFVPDLSEFVDGQFVKAKNLSRRGVWLDAATHDATKQIFEFQRVRIDETGYKLVPFRMRYAWPSELDLMAHMAGLKLKERWGGWDCRNFDNCSRMHVSVYQKPMA